MKIKQSFQFHARLFMILIEFILEATFVTWTEYTSIKKSHFK